MACLAADAQGWSAQPQGPRRRRRARQGVLPKDTRQNGALTQALPIDCAPLLRQAKFIESLHRGEQRQERGGRSSRCRGKTRETVNTSVRVFVDFDGTISVDDTTERMLERFADPSWGVSRPTGGRAASARTNAWRARSTSIRATPKALDAFARTRRSIRRSPASSALCAAPACH